MRKIHLSLFLIVSVFYMNGQTRQETESWILNKLKIYNNESGEIDFQLDGSSLKIHYKWNSSTDKETFYVVPVWAIESIVLINSNLTFYLSRYCKSCKKIVSGRKKKYRKEYYTVTKYGWGKGEQISWQEEKSRRVPDGYSNYRE